MPRKISRRQLALGLAVPVTVAFAFSVGNALAGSKATPSLPEVKAQRADQQQAALAVAQAKRVPKAPEVAPAVGAIPEPTRSAGIVAMRQGPFSPATFLVRNLWQGPIGSDWLLAYAGAVPAAGGSAPRGALRVYTESTDARLTMMGTFPAPAGVGPLTITAAAGDLLELRADDGTTLSFSLGTKLYR